MSYIVQGRSYKEIGAEMNISVHTVHSHIKNIYGKIQATTRSDALKKPRQIGAF